MQKKYLELSPYINWRRWQIVERHKLAYLEYGEASNPNILFCAHGLTRNATDFTKLAKSLAADFRVIAIDYPGRGNSDYFSNKKYYNYYVYLQDTLLFFKKLGIKKPFWLGTSMGGIIGMALACYFPKILRGLILNDVGPELPISTVKKIGRYAAQELVFADLNVAKEHLKMIYSRSGIGSEEDWEFITQNSFKINSANQYQMNYDPAVSSGIQINSKKSKDVDMWKIWHKINCPMLVIHGAKSDILTTNTIKKMQATKKFDLHTVNYAGHAPGLTNLDEIIPIKNWLTKFIK